jgi:hypothetical protein
MCCDHRIGFLDITRYAIRPMITSKLSCGTSISVPGNCLQLMQRGVCITFYKTCMHVATSELLGGTSIGNLMNSWHQTLLFIYKEG